MPLGTGGARMCWHCYEWHAKALAIFSGAPPPGCQECGLTFADLAQQNGDVPMAIHTKDGLYQVLCLSCSDRYERKRVDLYGDTAYGWKKKLKGVN